jgi:hypothetical protein
MTHASWNDVPRTQHASTPRYPGISVQLVGTDGNAHAVLGRVRRALRDAGIPTDEVQAFTKDATSADYDHLLDTCMRWVDVS